MNGQDDVTRHHKTHGSAEEGIASEMITGGDAGEANGAGHAVGYERYPAMPAIPVSDHGGYGGCCHGVARKESARMERIMGTVEETVSIGTVSHVREWLPPGCKSLQRNIQQKSIRDGFGREQCGILRIGIFMQQTYPVDSRGNSRDKSRGVGSAKNTVVATKVICCAEGWCRVRIAGDQAGSHA